MKKGLRLAIDHSTFRASHPAPFSVYCALLTVVMCAIVACGCGGSPKPAPPPPQSPPATPANVTATMRAVDLAGKPVRGMVPIATREANAFDEPIVRGEPTKEDGTTMLVVPSDQRVFLRMWDPTFSHFANNFYEVQPGGQGIEDVMDIAMVAGSSLDMTLSAPTASVDIMMVHPTQGPWWPARGHSDATGHVHFDSVPAGMFTIRIKAQPGGTAELDNVKLQPGGATDLGPVPLSQ